MTNSDAFDETRAVELAYRSIREQILTGEQAGGEWLRESGLAATLGVSRIPVREALRRLSAEGLVRHERDFAAHRCKAGPSKTSKKSTPYVRSSNRGRVGWHSERQSRPRCTAAARRRHGCGRRAMRLLDVTECGAARQQQPRAAAARTMAYAIRIHHDRLDAGQGTRIRRRASGDAGADDHDVGGLFTAKAGNSGRRALGSWAIHGEMP